MSDCDFLYKVVVIGDSGVGKSNLITRFTKNSFNLQPKPTIGVEFAAKAIMYDGARIRGQIWDTAGQERFQAVSAAYYRGSHGALIVYDITNRETFDHLEKWFTEIGKQGEEGCIHIIIGNKCDLSHQRQVTVEEGRNFAEKKNVMFMETSALDSTNVEEAFSLLLQNIYKTRKQVPPPTTNGMRLDDHVPLPQVNDEPLGSCKVSIDVSHHKRPNTSAQASSSQCCK